MHSCTSYVAIYSTLYLIYLPISVCVCWRTAQASDLESMAACSGQARHLARENEILENDPCQNSFDMHVGPPLA